ncbi:MAG: hypothetical protein JOZ29_06475 [Deltaproteobacteria bacterium]|nr:hypothetical protein [Deltaproteobacteria bacterium]
MTLQNYLGIGAFSTPPATRRGSKNSGANHALRHNPPRIKLLPVVKPKYVLDFKLIKDQINRLLESVPNKLELEWPKSRTASSDPAFLVLLGTANIVSNTFKAIRLLCSDKSQDWRLRPEMALVVPTLARTILDALYICIFLFKDLPSRADWYVCSGWKELAEYIDRARRDYASDPDWAEYLIDADTNLASLAKLIAKPPDELRRTRWWPTPHKMNSSTKSPTTAAFFGYLNDWFYREFSQVSHGSLPGLIHTVGALRDLAKGEAAKLEQLRGYYSMRAVMLLITFYSEIEAELTIGVTSDLKYVWQMLIQHNPFAKEIYDRRGYANRLT